MDALIFYHYSKKLTGSLFNAFEYYLTILNKNKNFYLFLLDCPKSDLPYLYSIFENRYNLENIDYKKNIVTLPFYKIVHQKFNNVLVLDFGTIDKTKGCFTCKNLTVICEYTKKDSKYMYSKKFTPSTYYGEMPFITYKDKEYRMKIGFKYFKKLKKVNSAVYINSPYNNDFSFIKDLPIPKDKPLIYKSDNHLSNLFEQFDEYVYYHANKWFDPHPRLFMECFYYDKKIHYFNPLNIMDGSYYRYNDLIQNGLKDRFLDENDEIVRIFL